MSKLSFLDIRNETEDAADLYIYGEIIDGEMMAMFEDDVWPEMIRDQLKSVEDKRYLNIYINSPGGSVFAGMAITNMLKRHKARKTVYVDGMAASIASVIALAGDSIVIPSNAFLMVHKPWTIALGNSDEFLKLAEDLEDIETGMMNAYEEKLKDGVDIESVRALVQKESWLNGREAAEYFDVSLGEPNTIAARLDGTVAKHFRNMPEALKAPAPDKGGGDDEKVKQLKIQNELDLLAL